MIKNKSPPKRAIKFVSTINYSYIITRGVKMLNITKRKNNRLLVSLDNETYDTIIELSEKYDVSLSEIGRVLIEKGLEYAQ